MLGIIFGALGILIGFIYWVKSGLRSYIIVWSIVTLCFISTMMILFYIGGRRRIKEEKNMIEQNQRKMSKMQGKNEERNV